MVQTLCLDTDVMIQLLNKDEQIYHRLLALDLHFATTSVNSFEIWYGRKQPEAAKEFLDNIEIINFDDTAARKAADIMRSLKSSGRLIEFRDVFIASVCISHSLPLFTLNMKHFSCLEKFNLVLWK